MRTYKYSLLWRGRNITALLAIGALLFTVAGIKNGLVPTMEEPWRIVMIWLLFCIFTLPQVYKERALAKTVIINEDNVTINCFNGSVTKFKLSEVSKIDILETSESLNYYLEKEMVIVIIGREDKCIVPVNIEHFDELFGVLSKRTRTGHGLADIHKL